MEIEIVERATKKARASGITYNYGPMIMSLKIEKEVKIMIENVIANAATAYKLSMEYFSIMSDMDRLMEEKGKTEDEAVRKYLDYKYDELAEKLFKIQAKLKAIEIGI